MVYLLDYSERGGALLHRYTLLIFTQDLLAIVVVVLFSGFMC